MGGSQIGRKKRKKKRKKDGRWSGPAASAAPGDRDSAAACVPAARGGGDGAVGPAATEGAGEEAVELVEVDAVEVSERKATAAALLYASAVRALRAVPADAEFRAGHGAGDPLRAHLEACAALLGRAFLAEERDVAITDEVLALAQGVAFGAADLAELRHAFSARYVRTLPPLPPLGAPRVARDAAGNARYDLRAYDRRDVLVGKAVFVAFMLFTAGRLRAALALFDNLIQCIRNHLVHHPEFQQQQQQQQQQATQKGPQKSNSGGGGGKSIGSSNGASNGSNSSGSAVTCTCPNDAGVVAKLLEFRSMCHLAQREYGKARRDLATAIALGGPLDEYMLRALLVFPAGVEESGWKEDSIADLRMFLSLTAAPLAQCPCLAEYARTYGTPAPGTTTTTTADANDDAGGELVWAWPRAPATEDGIVRWSLRAPPCVARVTARLLQRRWRGAPPQGAAEGATEGATVAYSLREMVARSACTRPHEARHNAFLALSYLLGECERPTARGLHMYLMAQLEKQAMVYHQFFDNAMREVLARRAPDAPEASAASGVVAEGAAGTLQEGADTASLTEDECLASWGRHCGEYPTCNTNSDIQRRTRQMYHKQRPCVVCCAPAKTVCSHCHQMPVCSEQCLARVWLKHSESFPSCALAHSSPPPSVPSTVTN